MTSCVNIRRGAYDIKIMRPSIWGNPYRLPPEASDQERLECLIKYTKRLCRIPELVNRARKELKNLALGCCCDPKLCHGHVLARVVDGEDPFDILKELTDQLDAGKC